MAPCAEDRPLNRRSHRSVCARGGTALKPRLGPRPHHARAAGAAFLLVDLGDLVHGRLEDVRPSESRVRVRCSNMPSLHLAKAPVPSSVRTSGKSPDLWPSPPRDNLPALKPQPDAFGLSSA